MDSDFRKPFEYEEEKKGLIRLFVIMIIVVDTIQTLSIASQEYKYLGYISLLGKGFFVIAVIFILYIIYTAVVVFKMKNNFVIVAKTYIVIRTVFTLANFVIVFINILKHEKLIGDAIDQYQSVNEMMVWELLIPLLYILSFSVLWYLYFTYSKRCRNNGID